MGRGNSLSATPEEILYGSLSLQVREPIFQLSSEQLADSFGDTLFFEDRGGFCGGRYWGARGKIPENWLERGRLVTDNEPPELANYQKDTFYYGLVVGHIESKQMRTTDLTIKAINADTVVVISDDGKHHFEVNRLELAAVEFLSNRQGQWRLSTTDSLRDIHVLCYLDKQGGILGYHAAHIVASEGQKKPR